MWKKIRMERMSMNIYLFCFSLLNVVVEQLLLQVLKHEMGLIEVQFIFPLIC